MNATVKKGILYGIPAILILIQFRPVDRSNPAVSREIHWDSPATAELARRACYDCHSNETVWPWYSYVAPVSWLIAEHVEHGRRHLNFSTWDQPNEDADEIVEVVEKGEMPLKQYLPLHAEARLSEEEKEALIAGLKATLAADPPVSEEGEAAAEGTGMEGGHERATEGHAEGEEQGEAGEEHTEDGEHAAGEGRGGEHEASEARGGEGNGAALEVIP